MPSLFNRLFRKEKSTSHKIVAIKVGVVVNQRYQLKSELGRGGMGIIYKAHDLIENREVAFKVINPETANSLSLNQFAREADILSSFDHPHIVSVYGTGFVNEDPSLPFLVMELLHGRPLSEIGALTYSRIISIAKQICEALAYIHSQGFVYRDIKPNNILLKKRGFDYFVKLIDFGLARPLGDAYLPNESSLAGTVFYLAPELIEGQVPDVQSDLYALGILLYEMIVGRVPFSDVDEATIQLQHQQQKASPLSQSRLGVPMELDALVLRLLEKKPQDRPASANEVCEILNSIRFDKKTQGNLPPNIPDRADAQPIIQLLAEHSLVTLISNDMPLALAAVSHLSEQFPDGVWVVNLEAVSEPVAVLPMVCSMFGVKEIQNRPLAVTLIEFLREKNLLLLLAHCGRVSGACAQLASAITVSCPDVQMMAVSDKPLNLPNEKVYSTQSKIL